MPQRPATTVPQAPDDPREIVEAAQRHDVTVEAIVRVRANGLGSGRSVDEIAEQLAAEAAQSQLGELRRILEYPQLKQVLKFVAADRTASYAFEQEDGTKVPVGTARQLFDPRHVEAVVYDAAGVPIKHFKPSDWRVAVVYKLPSITVEVETGGGEAVETTEWLESWLRHRLVEQKASQSLGEALHAAKSGDHAAPLRLLSGEVAVNIPSLGHFVRSFLKEPRTSDRALRTRLAGLGFRKAPPDGRIQAKHDGRPVELRCMLSPPGWGAPEES